MLNYETQFKSSRADGRFYSSMAAHMEMMRNLTPKLALPKDLTPETYKEWQGKVREKIRELLLLPERTPQPEPVLLHTVQREGYRVEKWELYPDDYTAVPFLILIPDAAKKETPAPGVLCLPGSIFSKELMAGEPMLEGPMCRYDRFKERNQMALQMVKNGMVAFALDNLETAEIGLQREEDYYHSRGQMCYGYIQSGLCYPGVSVFHKLCLLDFIKTLDYVDQDKLAISGHSLGTETGLYLMLLCDEFKALIFNDGLRDPRHHYMSITEYGEDYHMAQNIGNWHEVPGIMQWFGFPDLCAALAPKYLAFNEGGGDCWFEKVRRAYALFGLEDRVQVTHYPMFADESTHQFHGEHPKFGLSPADYDAFNYINAPDHSFREEPSIRLLKKCFGL
ncbi:MAG: hypothetical protein IKU17_07485 [Clostridia bacterium]|nr:hypothetical protein [Clostridia bacterium]